MLKATSQTAFGGQLPYNGSLSSNIHATSHEPLATKLPAFGEVQAFVGGVIGAKLFAGFYVAFLH